MRIMPSLVFRSTLLMSFLIVVVCLALTHGATLAKTNQVSGPVYVVIPAAQVNKLALPEITAAQVSAQVSEPVSAEVPADQVSALVSGPVSSEMPASQLSEFVVPDLTAVQVNEPASAEIPADQVSESVSPDMTAVQVSEPVSSEMPAIQGCELNDRYPESILQWCDLIVENANAHDLPPNLLAALIWLESGGNPSAYSASGAVGLMQVMPRDGLAASFMCANGPCFASRPTIDELQDPEYNIEYGTRMLAGLFARYQDMREALKSYGPHDTGYSYADKVLGIYERYGGE